MTDVTLQHNPDGRRNDQLSMRVGIRYMVTHASQDGEFEVGDRVRMLDDGCIANINAGGWMAAEDVPAATRGMQVTLDTEWAAAMRADLERRLAALSQASAARRTDEQ